MLSDAITLLASWALGLALVAIIYRFAAARRSAQAPRPDSPNSSALALSTNPPASSEKSIYHANKEKGKFLSSLVVSSELASMG